MFYKSLDLFAFRDDSRDWNSEIFDLYSKIKESEIRSIEKRDSSRILKANLFLQLDDYTGTYNHDLAGEIIISVSGNQLNININNFLSLVGTHWHYNTFITGKNESFQERSLINFTLNNKGKIDKLHLFNLEFKKNQETN